MTKTSVAEPVAAKISETDRPAVGAEFSRSRVITRVLWLRRGALTSTDKLVLLCLAGYASTDGRHVWPSVATLAEDSFLTERAVQKALRRLAAHRFIMVVGHRARGAVEYAIDLKALPLYREPRSQSAGQKALKKAVHDRESRSRSTTPRPRTTCTSGVNHVHPRGEPRSPDLSNDLSSDPRSLRAASTPPWTDRTERAQAGQKQSPAPPSTPHTHRATPTTRTKSTYPQLRKLTWTLIEEQVGATGNEFHRRLRNGTTVALDADFKERLKSRIPRDLPYDAAVVNTTLDSVQHQLDRFADPRGAKGRSRA
jgi:hypothetical protein